MKIAIVITVVLIFMMAVAGFIYSKNNSFVDDCKIQAINLQDQMNKDPNTSGLWSVVQYKDDSVLNVCFGEYKVVNLQDNWERYYIYNLQRKVREGALTIDDNGLGGAYKNYEDEYFALRLKIFGK